MMNTWKFLVWTLVLYLAGMLLSDLAFARDAATRLAEKYGVRFSENGLKPTDAELHSLLDLLDRIPAPLSSASRSIFLNGLSLTILDEMIEKGHSFHNGHQALFWQLPIVRIPGQSTREHLDRKVLHHLLHIYDRQHHISSSSEWLTISGWSSVTLAGFELPTNLRGPYNQDTRGYATPTGMSSASEDFATFGESWLLDALGDHDSRLRCRLPEKDQFFRSLFAAETRLLTAHLRPCRPAAETFLDDLIFYDPITRKPVDIGPINDQTVLGFELLYATPGVSDPAEVAGHLLLRIKLRHSAENHVAAATPSYHPFDLVVAFLADTEPHGRSDEVVATRPSECSGNTETLGREDRPDSPLMTISQSLRGLGGGFYTVMDRQTMIQTVRTYTELQDRNLLRYELNLTAAQKSTLITRLHSARNSFRTRYYFFDRNCASVLVRIISEGIGNTALTDFDPLVAPPNALVAWLVRHGLATPVYPSIYSYRTRAQIALTRLLSLVSQLPDTYPEIQWPSGSDMTDSSPQVRARFWRNLGTLAALHPHTATNIFDLTVLGQDAELAWVDRSTDCADFTTLPTHVMRDIQSEIRASRPGRVLASDVASHDLSTSYQGTEQTATERGSAHTGLQVISLGAGHSEHSGVRHTTAVASYAVHSQKMGDASSRTMQRATDLTLGRLSATVRQIPENSRAFRPAQYGVTGLKLRKFKETLDQVPPWWSGQGSTGLGLVLADITMRESDTYGTLAGGELLFNLASSAAYDNHFFLSIGADLKRLPVTLGTSSDARRHGIGLPVQLSFLRTFSHHRHLQFRANAGLTGLSGNTPVRFSSKLDASLAWTFLDKEHSQMILNATFDAESLILRNGDRTFRRIWLLNLEWNRW